MCYRTIVVRFWLFPLIAGPFVDPTQDRVGGDGASLQ